MSTNKKDFEQHRHLNKVHARDQTRKDTGKDNFLPQNSTGKDEFSTKTLEADRLSSFLSKKEEGNRPKIRQNDRNRSIILTGEYWIPQSTKIIEGRKLLSTDLQRSARLMITKLSICSKNSYKGANSLVITTSRIHPINGVFGTGWNASLMGGKLLEPKCFLSVCACNRPRLVLATIRTVEVLWATLLHACMPESGIKVMYGIVQALAATVPFDISLIDEYVKNIFRTKYK